MFMVLSIPF